MNYICVYVPQEPRLFTRIRKVTATKWEALIPNSPTPLPAIPTGPRGLVPFGARFIEQSKAAAAADLALIAMWGLDAAMPFLNGPVEIYSQQKTMIVGRLFGSDLSSYLLSICNVSKTIKSKRTKASTAMTVSRAQKLRKTGKKHGLVDEREPCGLCPACRFSFLNLKCYRKQLASERDYRVDKVAANIVDSGAPDASHDSDHPPVSDVEAGSEALHEEEEEEEEEGGEEDIGAAVSWLSEAVNTTMLQEHHQGEANLEWHHHPNTRLTEARKCHADWLAAELRTRQSLADSEDAQNLSNFIDMLQASSMPTAFAKAPDPTDILSPPEHKEIFDHAMLCAMLGADVSLVDEDDDRFAAPLGDSAIPPCMLCRGRHSKRNAYLECPIMRIAYATQTRPSKVCESCRIEGGCPKCRRSLPEFVWTPAFISTPWASSLAPETLHLMESLRDLGNAAVMDFDRPDVAGKLGPHALLAFGLLAEELVHGQFEANR